MKPTIKIAERLVSQDRALASAHMTAREQLIKSLNNDETKLWSHGAQLIAQLVSRRKTPIESQVIFKYLELHGFYNDEARSALWNGVGAGLYQLDNDLNVKGYSK